jgi:hypothetical protein
MRIRQVDERDSSWENYRPVFRVYLFRGGECSSSSWTTWTYDVEDADLLEVAQWAQDEAGDTGLYAVALVSERSFAPRGPPRRGLTWLIGTDANSEPLTPREAALHARMHELREKRVAII